MNGRADKIVLVTGGSGGIGAAIAGQFATLGCRVVIAARDHDKLAAAAAKIAENGAQVRAIACDVTRRDDIQRLRHTIQHHWGDVQILVNNAGIARAASFADMSDETWDQTLATNLTGAYNCCKVFLPAMIEAKWGRIVNIASTAAKVGSSHVAAYSASKHGLLGLTRSLALETARLGVTVNAICPGYVDDARTRENARIMAEKTGKSVDDILKVFAASAPQNRLIEAAEVAALACLIASPEMSGMTGQAINVDGGAVMARDRNSKLKGKMAYRSFNYDVADGIATIRLNDPERLNALTFETYAELERVFAAMAADDGVKVVVLTGAGKGFCSGGSVHGIIAKLLDMSAEEQLSFTTLTCAVVQNMRALKKPIIAAVNGIAAGAGAILALASDIRLLADHARFAFLFTKVGLSGADMGACYLLPRIVGHGRAAELLFTGETIDAQECFRIGLANRVIAHDHLMDEAYDWARQLKDGPLKAIGVTKVLLDREADMDLAQALDLEAREQARLMQAPDFKEGYHAFVEKRPAKFNRS